MKQIRIEDRKFVLAQSDAKLNKLKLEKYIEKLIDQGLTKK